MLSTVGPDHRFLRLFSKLSLSCARPCGHLQSWPLPDGGCTEGPANSEIPVDLTKLELMTQPGRIAFFFFFLLQLSLEKV